MNSAWQLQEAKSKLSELIDRAIDDGPQHITRHGKDAVVVLSALTYKKLTRRDFNLFDYFQNSPMRGADLDLERVEEFSRDIEL